MADTLVLSVLVVDDDADTRANLSDILELDGYRIDTAATIAEALDRSDWCAYLAIILDRKLPDGTAEELLPRLRVLAPEAAVLIVTGYADLQGAVAALRQGAADYILKPINPDALRASLARVAERRRLTQARERSEAAFRTLLEAAPCMIVILRPDHTLAYFSRFAEETTGYATASVLDRDYFTIFLPPEWHAPVALHILQVLGGTPTRGFETPVLCKDGSWRWMFWNADCLPDHDGAPAVLAVGQDITELKRAQEQALQSERLVAIGQMMTGLAHESGNALARSRACLDMLAWEVEGKTEAQELISGIRTAQDDLQQLYEEVRGYAASIRLERDSWDIRGVWRQAWANLALRREGRDAVLDDELDGVDLTCSIDAFRLEQVFRNILDNALAACADPVRITIWGTATELDGRPAVRIAVRDNGPGLNPEQARRIFDPFFTTKSKGTGLGMAIARRIVEAHRGRIAVGDGSGPGAEIVITLPRESL
jgi:PAS domain S-box-containing protein